MTQSGLRKIKPIVFNDFSYCNVVFHIHSVLGIIVPFTSINFKTKIIISKYKGEKKMSKHRKWVVALMLLLLINSTNAIEKDKPYPDGKGNDETFGVEDVNTTLDLEL